MPASQDVLVIGADSRIGCAAAKRLRARGTRVYGTTRRPEMVDDRTLYLDLREQLDVQALPRTGACLIAAAVTSLQECQRNPAVTERINVEAAVRLAEGLSPRGCFTLLLSTNQVFSGDKAFPSEDEPTRPATVYGKQKARAENEILTAVPHAAAFRLNKVLEALPPLFVDWRDRLAKAAPIEAFSDMVFAPLSLATTVDVIVRLLDRRKGGIFQISGDEDMTYLAAARLLAEKTGADRSLVRPVSAKSGELAFAVPNNTTLGMGRLSELLGMDAPSSRSALDEMLARVIAAK